ncbi:MAG: HEAT repeat domain-containing protein [bacterium]|nr:HEAT repeat domain-containing protein [bacterium]
MSDNTHLLTDEQMKDFIVNGYISVHTNLPSSVHKNIYKQTETVFEKEGNPGNNLLPRIPVIQEIFDSPPVQGALRSILGEEPYLQPHRHCHYNSPGSKGQKMHQDGGKRWSHHTRRLLAFYYPQHTPLELGPTGILPGSHYYNTPEGVRTIEECPLCGEAGTVVIVNYDLWHRAMPNLSDKKRYMMKFLFLRMSEPRKPSWDNQQTSWGSEDTGNHRRMFNHVWNWHGGKTGGQAPATSHTDIPERIEALGSDSEPTGLAAAYALSEFGAQAVPALVETLSTESEAKRRNACYGLSAIGEPAVEALIDALQDRNEGTRASAAEILGDIGPHAQPALPELIRAVQDESEQVRAHAAEALGTAGQMESTAVPALSLALQDENDRVRRNAALAFARLGHFARDAVGTLQAALTDENRYVRADAAYTLYRIGTPEAREVLLQFLTTSRWCSLTTPENTY